MPFYMFRFGWNNAHLNYPEANIGYFPLSPHSIPCVFYIVITTE